MRCSELNALKGRRFTILDDGLDVPILRELVSHQAQLKRRCGASGRAGDIPRAKSCRARRRKRHGALLEKAASPYSAHGYRLSFCNFSAAVFYSEPRRGIHSETVSR